MNFAPKQQLFLVTAFLLQAAIVFASPDEANTSAQPISNAQGIREAFIEAATNGNLEILRAIVPTQLGPNEAVFKDYVPLYYAVKRAKINQVQMVQYLLSVGANPNEGYLLDYLFETDWSLEEQRLSPSVSKAISLLIKAGARTKEASLTRLKAMLRTCIKANRPDLILAMLEAGFFSREDFKENEVYSKMRGSSFIGDALELDYQEVVAILVNSKLFDLRNDQNITHFVKVLRKSFYNLVDVWLNNVGNIEDFVSLISSRYHYKESIESLVNYLSSRFPIETPLGRATESMKVLINQDIEALLRFGYAQMHTPIKFYNISPGTYILSNFDLDKIEKFLEKGMYFDTPIYLQYNARRNIDLARLLLRYRPSIEFSEEIKSKLLFDAISCEDKDMVREFVERGFALGHKEKFLGSSSDHPEIAQFFIVHGSSPINNELFDVRVELEQIEAAEFFLQNGVDINHDRGTVLNKAVLAVAPDRCQFLIEHGADIRLLREENVLQILTWENARYKRQRMKRLFQFLLSKGYQPGEEVRRNSYFTKCNKQ